MKINAALVLEHRLERSLSQEELAIMSGLNIRTIQRVEREGVGSLQTKKSLAAALEINVHDLDHEESNSMKRYEYKTVEAPFKLTFLRALKSPDFENLINAEGRQGWRLHEVLLPAQGFGQTNRAVIIFERELMDRL
jgi:transcriptional regulator with XRE-family HTH domain